MPNIQYIFMHEILAAHVVLFIFPFSNKNFYLGMICESIAEKKNISWEEKETAPVSAVCVSAWDWYLFLLIFQSFQKYMHGLDPTKYVTLNIGSQVFSLVHWLSTEHPISCDNLPYPAQWHYLISHFH